MKWSQLIKITGQVGLTLQITCTLMSTQVHKYVLPECNMEVLLSRPITYRPPDPPNILIHLSTYVSEKEDKRRKQAEDQPSPYPLSMPSLIYDTRKTALSSWLQLAHLSNGIAIHTTWTYILLLLGFVVILVVVVVALNSWSFCLHLSSAWIVDTQTALNPVCEVQYIKSIASYMTDKYSKNWASSPAQEIIHLCGSLLCTDKS